MKRLCVVWKNPRVGSVLVVLLLLNHSSNVVVLDFPFALFNWIGSMALLRVSIIQSEVDLGSHPGPLFCFRFWSETDTCFWTGSKLLPNAAANAQKGFVCSFLDDIIDF